MKKIYEDKNFIILKKYNREAYILHNKKKPFKTGHTHINNYNTVRWLIKLYTKRIVPYNLKSKYLLDSLIRISNDTKYTEQLKTLKQKHIGFQF